MRRPSPAPGQLAPVQAKVAASSARTTSPPSVNSRTAASDGVADEPVGQPGGGPVERARARDTERGPARPPEILHGRQRAGIEDLDHRRSNRTRVPGASRAGLACGDVPQRHVGAAQQPPAAGGAPRVDAGELAGDRRPRRRARPCAVRLGAARAAAGQPVQIGEAGGEAAEPHDVVGAAVQRDDLVRSEPDLGCHLVEVGAVVDDRHRNDGFVALVRGGDLTVEGGAYASRAPSAKIASTVDAPATASSTPGSAASAARRAGTSRESSSSARIACSP